ncbi:MAG: efflux RND transporter periplasmic adaptor subunit [Pirellulales bacterium]|nr:efflux RND transporter periplasmic adaptor subunit [Pirellulales bacterium]
MSLVYFGILSAALAGAPQEHPAGPIEVPSMLVKPIEQTEVPAREAGALAAVEVSEGHMVEEGQVLARIEDAELRTAAEQAKIELEIARAQAQNDVNIRFAKKSAEVAEAELRRSAESNENYSKSVSESEMDRLRLVVEKNRLEIEQAQHELVIAGLMQQVKDKQCLAAQQKVERHTILAPLAGMVVQVGRHRGEWVKPGDMVVRILRLDRLRAEGFLPAKDVSPDLQGRRVRLLVDLPGQAGTEFAGTIVFLDPQIDPVNGQVRIWAEVENEGLRVRPGMRARMVIDAR